MDTARRALPAAEAELWRVHLAVLEQGFRLRKPDARARVRRETVKLEREVEALQARRKLAVGSDPRDRDPLAVQLSAAIARRLSRISDLAALVRRFAKDANVEDAGALPELAVRPAAVDPIEMLQCKGKLSDDQVRAAREIAWVHEAVTRAGRARVSRLGEIDPPKGWQEMPLLERAALIHAKRFVPWAERLRGSAPATLDIVYRIAVLGIAVYPVARRHRLGWARCVARLADGLDQYWAVNGHRRIVGGADPHGSKK